MKVAPTEPYEAAIQALEKVAPAPTKVNIFITDGIKPRAPKSSQPTELASINVRFTPAGTHSSPTPGLTLAPYLPDSFESEEFIELPAETATAIYQTAVEGYPLDTLLRREIQQQLAKAGYTLNLDTLKAIDLPTEILTQIAKGQAGLHIEYIERSVTNTKGIGLRLWQPEGCQLSQQQASEIDKLLLRREWTAPADARRFDPFDL